MFQVRCKAGREDIDLEIWSPGGRKDPRDFSADERWIVAAAREAMAKYASRRVGTMGTVAVRGRNVASFVARETDVRLVDFENYLSALGVAPERNETDKRYAFSVGGTNYLVLLGTSKTKVGSEWRSMQDQPMLVGGRVFVPKQYLPD